MLRSQLHEDAADTASLGLCNTPVALGAPCAPVARTLHKVVMAAARSGG